MLRWHNLRRTNDNWKYLLKDRVLSKASSVDFKIKASIVRFKIQLSLCLKHSGYNGLNNKVKSQIRSVSLLASKCISSVYREMHWDCAAMPSIGRLFASSMCSQSPTLTFQLCCLKWAGCGGNIWELLLGLMHNVVQQTTKDQQQTTCQHEQQHGKIINGKYCCCGLFVKLLLFLPLQNIPWAIQTVSWSELKLPVFFCQGFESYPLWLRFWWANSKANHLTTNNLRCPICCDDIS